MKRNYYVYGYYRLDTNELFYIGKGCNKRCFNLYHRGRHFTNIVNKVETAVVIFIDNLTEEEAFYYEEEAIEKLVFEYGYSIDILDNESIEHGCHLTNSTWGGEGVSAKKKKDHKLKISKSMKGKNVRGKGFKVNEDTKRKMSIAHGKYVVCEDMHSIFTSTADASYFMGDDTDTIGRKIAGCCRGELLQAYGYKWRYATEKDLHDNSFDIYEKDM